MVATTSGTAPPSDASPAQIAGPSPPPLRLLLIAVVWVFCAFLAGFLFTFAAGFIVGFHNALASGHGGQAWRPHPLIDLLLATSAVQLVFFFAAYRQGRVIGQGDRRTGIGLGPLYRIRLLSVLAVIEPAAELGWVFLLSAWLKPHHTIGIAPYFIQARLLGPAAELAVLWVTVAVAPVCEEMFFRGWLWTGLRRCWRAGPVMLATALFWLLLHAAQGLWRAVYLIPAAILFSLTRHWCGGVRASILLHVVNNGVAAVLLIVLLWVR